MIRATCIIFRKKNDRFAALHSMLIHKYVLQVSSSHSSSRWWDFQSKAKEIRGFSGNPWKPVGAPWPGSPTLLQRRSIAKYCHRHSIAQYCKVLYHLPLVLQSIVTDTGRRRGEKKILRFSVGTGSKSALCLYMWRCTLERNTLYVMFSWLLDS